MSPARRRRIRNVNELTQTRCMSDGADSELPAVIINNIASAFSSSFEKRSDWTATRSSRASSTLRIVSDEERET